MLRLRLFILLGIAPLAAWPAPAQQLTATAPQNFPFIGEDEPNLHAALIERPDIAGVQVVYSWKSPEHARGEFDFARIRADLNFLGSRGKKLFLQLQDRFFEPEHRHVPLRPSSPTRNSRGGCSKDQRWSST